MADDPAPPPRGKFRVGFTAQAAKLAALGAIDRDVADFFGVCETTLYRWKHAHPAFAEAMQVGKAAADARVEQSLYRRALGYSHDAVKIVVIAGQIHRVDYVEHYPPDTRAAIFWLKNRKPGEWRDTQEVEHSGALALARIERRIVDPEHRDAEGVPALAGPGPV